MTEGTRQKKRTLSPWIFLVFLLVLGVGNLGYVILRFWNLKLDLDGTDHPLPFSSGKSIVIPFVSGLDFNDLPENPTAKSLEDFDHFFETETEAAGPGSFSGILQEIAGSEKIWAEILSRSRISLASFPVAILGTGPLNLERPGILIGGLSETARFWTLLCFAQLGRVSSQDVATALLGIAMMAIHAEAVDSPYPLFGTRFAALRVLEIAYNGILRCSPGLRLSRPETMRMIGFLRAIESGLLSNQVSTIGHVAWFKAILENLCERAPVAFPSSTWRWPGSVLSEIYRSPDIVDFSERECFQKYISLASGSWVATHPEFLRIDKERKDANKLLDGSTLEIFWRFAFRPKAHFKAWFLSQVPFFLETRKKLDFEARQKLRMAQWALALSGFRRANKLWPRTPTELEGWLGATLPTDLFSYGPVLFTPGDPPDIRSIGPDQSPFTEDDILAVASGTASVAAFLDGVPEPSGSNDR